MTRSRQATGGVLVAAFIAAGLINVGQANEPESDHAVVRAELIEVARLATDRAAGEPCQPFTPYAYAQLVVPTDCDVYQARPDVLECQIFNYGDSCHGRRTMPKSSSSMKLRTVSTSPRCSSTTVTRSWENSSRITSHIVLMNMSDVSA